MSIKFPLSRPIVSVFGLRFIVATAFGQPPTQWLAHDLNRPRPPVVEPGPLNLPVAAPSDADAIRAALVKQLDHPVRWVESINKMADDGINTVIECGPGKVLVGLNKRINKQMQALPVFDAETLQAALDACTE